MARETGNEIEWAYGHLDQFLEGDLEREELIRFERILAASEEIREAVDGGRALLTELRALPKGNCPDRVRDEILKRTVGMKVPKPTGSASWMPVWGWPSLGLAAAVVLLFVGFQFAFRSRWIEPPVQSFTKAEVALAEEQVERTLEYLANFSSRTGSMVSHKVVEAGVVQPVRETARVLIKTRLAAKVLPVEKKES